MPFMRSVSALVYGLKSSPVPVREPCHCLSLVGGLRPFHFTADSFSIIMAQGSLKLAPPKAKGGRLNKKHATKMKKGSMFFITKPTTIFLASHLLLYVVHE